MPVNGYAEPEKIYTWWSYRAADWTVGDRGRRLDHIWVSQALGDRVVDFKITRDARSWERPSDHVPVTAIFDPRVATDVRWLTRNYLRRAVSLDIAPVTAVVREARSSRRRRAASGWLSSTR